MSGHMNKAIHFHKTRTDHLHKGFLHTLSLQPSVTRVKDTPCNTQYDTFYTHPVTELSLAGCTCTVI